ncbi:MAG: TatD family deoxyribonuclease [Chlamydiae bacterium CG10_big_fil_rev_8_21_14_0_10_35_9]|nr:MAG: TatD family deoxyribonuclease [Chlamydiae bacterium CG10_big_fil_rev_8_21_14_0_10_35_9]
MNLFDSHAHLSIDGVFQDIDEILLRAQKENVNAIMNICIDEKSLSNAEELSKKYPWVYHAGATTPHDVDKLGTKDFEIFKEAAERGFFKAIGETGLDYYYQHSDKQNQRKYLIKYLHLANKLNLPVIFHCRDAFSDLFKIVDNEYPKDKKAVLHCFTGNIDEAGEVIKRGWYLSLSGIVTFKKSEDLRKVASLVPIDQLLIETDTPYLAPQSKRGKQNEPSFIKETAQVIADQKQISIEELSVKTYDNASKCFNLQKP